MSVRYYNQSAPFWDFVAGLEEGGANHPFFGDRRDRGEGMSNFPWAWGPWAARAGMHPHPPPPPPPPEAASGDMAGEEGEAPPPFDDREMGEGEAQGQPLNEKEDGDGAEDGGKKREGCRRHHGPGPHGHAHGHGHGRGGWGSRGRGFFGGRGGCRARGPPPPGGFGPWNMRNMAEQLFGGPQDAEGGRTRTAEDGVEVFVPPVDVFDTEDAFVVHASLAGAKKEDVAVSWDAEKSELGISGVIHRPGDEELLKTLALDERRIGMFERKVRLGSRMRPANVDADGITAKMEDGVLRVEIPKEESGFVEVKKVDVE